MANLFLQFIFNKKILATQKACWSFQNKFAIKRGGKKKNQMHHGDLVFSTVS